MTTIDTHRTHVRSGLRPHLAGLAVGAVAAAAGLGLALPTVAQAAPAPVAAVAAPQTAAKGTPQYIAINQFATGAPAAEENNDCGPVAVVSSILSQGYTPKDWPDDWSGDDDTQALAAVQTARSDTGADPTAATTGSQVERAIGAQSVPVTTSSAISDSLGQVRAGKTAIVEGWMDYLPYSYSYGRPHYKHWITVTDYDADTGTFTILDSNDGSVRTRITEAGITTFQNSLAEFDQIIVG